MTSTTQPSAHPGASTFLVERYWPGITHELLAAAIARGELEAGDPTRVGGRVRRLGSVLLAADEVVFCLFTADSADAVAEVNDRARFPYDRIVAGTWLPGARGSGSDEA